MGCGAGKVADGKYQVQAPAEVEGPVDAPKAISMSRGVQHDEEGRTVQLLAPASHAFCGIHDSGAKPSALEELGK